MRLRTLQIKGFKSFANDTVLNFDEDVIGVVGPNGAGKSNIVDAIRWVLGEQKSRELRLEKMSDIIFNGTKSRKEAGVAQVALTFDNTKNILPTEYQSVTISRHLFRNGDSEYRLNNVACRLKDIKSLFIDTGIGSNSYAIIALGMVDDILADKDNARRKMFEQASGISKYKTRKKETLSKLKSTSEDLDRIEDLLFEIEGNLKSLEKQARRTKRYFEIKDQYKELAIQHSLRSISTLKEQYKKLGDTIVQQESEYRDLLTSQKNIEAEIESMKGSNLNNEEELSTKQKELNTLINDLRENENQKNLSIQKLEFRNQELTQINADLESGKKEIEGIQASLVSLENRVAQELVIADEKKQAAAIAKEDYDKKRSDYVSVRNDADTFTKEKEKLFNTLYDSEKQLAICQTRHENVDAEMVRIDALLSSATADKSGAESNLQSITQIVAQVQAERDKELARIEKGKENIQDVQAKIEGTKRALSSMYRQKDAASNEYDLVKSMVDSYEGFPASIKFLSSKWDKKVPILSDLLDVKDGYKAVLEQYLDQRLNSFVVDKLEDAKSAISLLRKSQQGKASFLILDKVLPASGTKEGGFPGCISARSVVTVEKKYESLLDNLLHNVLIVEDENMDITLDQGDERTILSKEGQYIRRGYTLQGGSVGLFEGNKIGRKKNLKTLTQNIKKYESEIETNEALLKNLESEIEKLKSGFTRNQLNAIDVSLKEEREKLLSAQFLVNSFNKDLEKNLAEKKRLENDRNNLSNQLAKLEETKKVTQQKINTLSQGRLFTDEELEKMNQAVLESQEKFNNLNIEAIRQFNLYDNLKKDYDFKKQQKQDLEKKSSGHDAKKDSIKVELEELRLKINNLETALSEQYTLRDAQRASLSQVEKDYYSARNIINEKEDESKKINRSLNQKQVQVNELKDKYNDVKFNISGVSERLKIEFNIQLNDIINDPVEETMPFEELGQKVEKMKYRISNFGEINPMAVTAYEEMKERYDSIYAQREDILDAKQSLIQTINEIENTATEQFMDAFMKVRENFIEVFQSLFSQGDRCDLILLDPQNPLDSQIEIIAKPKGKKPQSLSQLSGGEKTLTATALLFSLYLLKPAPFCIFDEVDAPLDDANIQKFNKIIKKFSEQSQFIIVTHNKSTMAAVDVLYGVYMQEQGISGVSPVDFRQYDHEPVLEVVNN